jgi:hypothetical protein
MANNFKVYDLYATTFNVSNRPLVNGTGIVLSGEALTSSYVTGVSGSLQTQLNSAVFITGNQIVSGAKTFSDPTVFNSTSITAPNQTISGASSLLTKGLADSLYGTSYFSITTGLSSGIDNDTVGQKIHSFILPSGTYEFQCFAALSGTVATGGQGIRFYLYPNSTYSFYGNSIRHSINLVALSTASSATVATNSNSPFSLYSLTNTSSYAMMINGIFNVNQTTEIPIYIGQLLQRTGEPVYLMQGSYLKASKVN